MPCTVHTTYTKGKFFCCRSLLLPLCHYRDVYQPRFFNLHEIVIKLGFFVGISFERRGLCLRHCAYVRRACLLSIHIFGKCVRLTIQLMADLK